MKAMHGAWDCHQPSDACGCEHADHAAQVPGTTASLRGDCLRKGCLRVPVDDNFRACGRNWKWLLAWSPQSVASWSLVLCISLLWQAAASGPSIVSISGYEKRVPLCVGEHAEGGMDPGSSLRHLLPFYEAFKVAGTEGACW